MVLNVVLQLSLAVGLFVLGTWGRHHSDLLAPRSLPEEHRARRVRALRRGSLACQVIAVVFALAAVPVLL